MRSKIILCLLFIGLVSCNLHLNFKFRSILDGEDQLTNKIAKQIYAQFRSPYTSKSDYRFQVFLDTLKQIRQHNTGDHSWKQGINDFSDMTFEEFKENKLMTPQDCSATNSLKIKEQIKLKAIPDSYEWNDYGMVSPVKNQASCGSCWTFSTVGSMQSHWNILGKGKNLTFSQQQLVDCADDFDNHGCNGGLPSHAFQYIKYSNGLQSDITYPYRAKTMSCVYRPSIGIGYAKYGSYNITNGDQKECAQRLYNAGPISVSFQVINGFKNYVSGVYSVDNCGKTTKDVNHAVLATGYGSENGKDFWNIKNSWGAGWGNNGYFKMQKGTNMCAVAQCNAYPLIDSLKDFQEQLIIE